MLEEGELRLEDVHVKYDGIISKTKEIKDQSKRIDDSIVYEKNIYEISMQIHE